MELSWLTKLRIAVVVAVGVLLIGVVAWPIAEPDEPFAAVSLIGGSVGLTDAIVLFVLAILAGFLGYFLSWPYGREIGILAVPAGLALWAVRSGNMSSLARLNPTLSGRQELIAAIRWEPFLWLVVVAAGFGGVLIGQIVSGQKVIEVPFMSRQANFRGKIYSNAVIALALSVFVVWFCLEVFAKDVTVSDSGVGTVVAQPVVGQIAFAVLVSFGIAGFLVKRFLDLSYIWPVIASALVIAFVDVFYIRADIVEHVVERYPVGFFASSVSSILPLQMVSFGTLGSIVGYWTAVRCEYWQKHEIL